MKENADDFCVINPDAPPMVRKTAHTLCGPRVMTDPVQEPHRVSYFQRGAREVRAASTSRASRAHSACSPCDRAQADRSPTHTRTKRIGRPPRKWMKRCIAGVEKSGGSNPKLGGPGAICGSVWYHKLTPKKRAEVRREYEARTGKKWIHKVKIRKPGVLRAHILSVYGKGGFDSKGRIRCDLLTRMTHEGGIWGRRARYALNLRRIGGTCSK